MHGDGRGWLAKWVNPLLRRYPGWPFVSVPCLFMLLKRELPSYHLKFLAASFAIQNLSMGVFDLFSIYSNFETSI
jgi:hypothetical protein